MTEKEKMLSGNLYRADDIELVKERKVTKDLVSQYNSLDLNQKEEQKEIIKKLFAKTGKEFNVKPNFFCDYGSNIEIGENFFSNYNLVILDVAKVIIGDNVMIGPNVGIYTAGHPLDYTKRREGFEYGYPITIGNDVWIGGNVSINPGVTIGNNVVIGSGSVVTKDLPDNIVAVGNPCRVIKQL